MLSEDLKRKIEKAVQRCAACGFGNGEPLKDIHDRCEYDLEDDKGRALPETAEIYDYEWQYCRELIRALEQGKVRIVE